MNVIESVFEPENVNLFVLPQSTRQSQLSRRDFWMAALFTPLFVMIRSSAKAWIEIPAGRFSLSASSERRFHRKGGHPFSILVTNSMSRILKVAVLSLNGSSELESIVCRTQTNFLFVHFIDEFFFVEMMKMLLCYAFILSYMLLKFHSGGLIAIGLLDLTISVEELETASASGSQQLLLEQDCLKLRSLQ